MGVFEYLTVFFGGALGALINLIMDGNCIQLPKKIDDKFSLGFIGALLTGGVAGFLIDGSFITAFMGGITGSTLINGLIPGAKPGSQNVQSSVEGIIRNIAKSEGVDPDLAVRVAKCESALDPEALNINKDGSADRGIFQINSKWHPEVTLEQAKNIEFATKFFCKAFKGGNLSWWNASRSCWNI